MDRLHGELETFRGLKQLEAVLDKLVAVGMDLVPAGEAGRARLPVLEPLEVIAGASEILRSAIADVRLLIRQGEEHSESAPLAACMRAPSAGEPWSLALSP